MSYPLSKSKILEAEPLCLRASGLDISDIDTVKPSLTGALKLYVSNNSIETIENIGQFRSLEVFLISYNLISCIEDLKPLTSLKYLKSLNLEGNPICYLSLYKAYVLYYCPNLEELDGVKIKKSSYYQKFPPSEINKIVKLESTLLHSIVLSELLNSDFSPHSLTSIDSLFESRYPPDRLKNRYNEIRKQFTGMNTYKYLSALQKHLIQKNNAIIQKSSNNKSFDKTFLSNYNLKVNIISHIDISNNTENMDLLRENIDEMNRIISNFVEKPPSPLRNQRNVDSLSNSGIIQTIPANSKTPEYRRIDSSSLLNQLLNQVDKSDDKRSEKSRSKNSTTPRRLLRKRDTSSVRSKKSGSVVSKDIKSENNLKEKQRIENESENLPQNEIKDGISAQNETEIAHENNDITSKDITNRNEIENEIKPDFSEQTENHIENQNKNQINNENQIQNENEINDENQIQNENEINDENQIQNVNEINDENQIQNVNEINDENQIQNENEINDENQIQNENEISDENQIQNVNEINDENQIQNEVNNENEDNNSKEITIEDKEDLLPKENVDSTEDNHSISLKEEEEMNESVDQKCINDNSNSERIINDSNSFHEEEDLNEQIQNNANQVEIEEEESDDEFSNSNLFSGEDNIVQIENEESNEEDVSNDIQIEEVIQIQDEVHQEEEDQNEFDEEIPIDLPEDEAHQEKETRNESNGEIRFDSQEEEVNTKGENQDEKENQIENEVQNEEENQIEEEIQNDVHDELTELNETNLLDINEEDQNESHQVDTFNPNHKNNSKEEIDIESERVDFLDSNENQNENDIKMSISNENSTQSAIFVYSCSLVKKYFTLWKSKYNTTIPNSKSPSASLIRLEEELASVGSRLSQCRKETIRDMDKSSLIHIRLAIERRELLRKIDKQKDMNQSLGELRDQLRNEIKDRRSVHNSFS